MPFSSPSGASDTAVPRDTDAARGTAPMPASAIRWPHATVLVVDDEPGMRHFIEGALRARVGTVLCAGSAEAAEDLQRRHRVDLLVLDITLPGRSGLDLLRDLRAAGDDGEAVLITAFADLDTAIEALRAGAGDLLLKPFRVPQLVAAVERGLERARLRRENFVLRRTLAQRTPPADGLVGRSLAIKGLQAALRRVAPVDSTVLLTGGSGTGKELAAQALHAQSQRAAGPFVPVNCAMASAATLEVELFGQARGAPGDRPQRDGLFVYAQGGTLFLDEIADLPLSQQSALLRVLECRRIRPVGGEQEIPVDVRIVAATNRLLRAEVEAGRFRADLYYRLAVVEINLPPLASHKEDIPDLVEHFVQTLAPRLGVPPIGVDDEEMRYLGQYDWPGNVRELRNLIERSLIVGALNVSALYRGLSRTPGHLPPGAAASLAAGLAPMAGSSAPAPRVDGPTDLHTLEKRHILAVLASVSGDKARAAELLGISRRTLERRLADWGEGPA